MTVATPDTPPYKLEGIKLPGGWIVGPLCTKGDNDTGGHFSGGYFCSSESDASKTAFVKAIDLYTPLSNRGGNVLQALQPLIEIAQGERDLLTECRGMDRVVKIIDQGDIHELGGQQLLIPVPYIIFERAESTARQLIFNQTPAPSWGLRTL